VLYHVTVESEKLRTRKLKVSNDRISHPQHAVAVTMHSIMRKVSFVRLKLFYLVLLKSRMIFGHFVREKFFLQGNSIGIKSQSY
jgi:hypothetical protein